MTLSTSTELDADEFDIDEKDLPEGCFIQTWNGHTFYFTKLKENDEDVALPTIRMKGWPL